MVRVRVENFKVVARPVHQVYAYLADFRRHAEWDGDSRAFVGAAGPVELGAVFERHDVCEGVTGGALGSAPIRTTRIVTRTVTHLERDRRLEYTVKGENGLMHRVEYFELEPAVEGTRLTMGTDLMYPALRKDYLWLALLVPIVWPFVIMNLLFLPSAVAGVKLGHGRKLRLIKERLEGSGWEATGSLPRAD